MSYLYIHLDNDDSMYFSFPSLSRYLRIHVMMNHLYVMPSSQEKMWLYSIVSLRKKQFTCPDFLTDAQYMTFIKLLYFALKNQE